MTDKKFTITNTPIQNKKGKIIGKEIQIKPSKNKTIPLLELNKVYKQLMKTHDPFDIVIRAEHPDGMKTLKSYNTNDDDLTHTFDDYYKSLTPEKRNKYANLGNVYIMIRNN